MHLYRIRIQVTDSPGHLGRAAAALGGLGANILDVDVQSLQGGYSADDLLVDLTRPLDLPAVEHALEATGCAVLSIVGADAHELVDQTTYTLELARMLVEHNDPLSDEAIADYARRMVRADLAWVGPNRAISPRSASDRALETGVATQTCEPIDGGTLWSLAIPFEVEDATRRVLVLVRENPKFSYAESARVDALLRLAQSAGRWRPTRKSLKSGKR